MRGRKSSVGAILAVIGILAALTGAPAAGSQAALPLTNEFLLGSTSATSYEGEVDCDPAGISTLTASATGAASGPYPGTFEETVTVTVAGGQVQSVAAEFTIFSGDTRIEGTKELASEGGGGACERTDSGSTCTEIFLASAIVTYSATIIRPTGTSTESGTATLATPAGFQGPCESTEVVFGQINEFFFGPSAPAARGHATGGGQLERPLTETPVTFGLSAHSDEKGTKGKCSVLDHATGEHVRCLNVTSYTQTGGHAVFSGDADVDGLATTYRIEVMDNGSSGIGQDSFAIETDSGFAAAGVLTAGNVTVTDG
ncbi:MAG: post-COAP-1 domain-containing protein [Gaiellaceae bacterium]